MTYLGAPLMSEKQDWGTPLSFFDYVEKTFDVKFTLDACASAHNYKVDQYMTEQDDALIQEWCESDNNGNGKTYEQVWLNPPYGNMQKQFIVKAATEAVLGNCRVFALIPARTDTRLFHEVVLNYASAVYFIKGRLHFEESNRKKPNNRGSSTHPSMLVIFDGKVKNCHLDTLTPTKEERGC